MKGLVALADQTLGCGRPVRIPYALGMAAGAVCDWLGQVTGQQLPISRIRVKKYAADTRFAAGRMARTGFTPRHSLHDALVTTIRHEFLADDRAQATPSRNPFPASSVDR